MPRHELKSSFISHCEHDDTCDELTVTFQNGKTYTYQGFTKEDVNAFVKAPSASTHFNQFKNNYKLKDKDDE